MIPVERRRAALVSAAREAIGRAYAPYSRYRVGAAVLDEQGRVWRGVNVENASFGLTLCAERSAVSAAIAAGARRVIAVAVAAEDERPPFPCGACRQVLTEFGSPSMPVWIAAGRRVRRIALGRLLPSAFSFTAASTKGQSDAHRSRAQSDVRRRSR